MGDSQSVALYRKYRGLNFGDIVGQKHITDVLERAIKNDRVSHAYLFTGPRGVGKTSVARILAHEINGLAYEHENNHIDIIEIDAASNRRIDEIRDLREKSHIAPVSAKFKVYIIDEVHMLTKEAFNALLKTLEEPPAHVVFILATTEAHKLPQTIVSRTQRHTFRPITVADATEHLRSIAKKESIDIDDEALTLIAQRGDGSFRDAISLLDQLSGVGGKTITADEVRTVLGLGSPDDVQNILTATYEGNSAEIIKLLTAQRELGLQPELLAKQLIETIQASEEYVSKLSLVSQLLEVGGHPQPALKLELSLLQHTSPATNVAPAIQSKQQPAPKNAEIEQKPSPETTHRSEEPPVAAPQQRAPVEEAEEPSYGAAKKSLNEDDWGKIVDLVKQGNNAVASILRNGSHEVSQGGDSVTIYVRFAFHKKKLEDASSRALIHGAMNSVLDGVVKMEIEVDPSKLGTKSAPKEAPPDEHDELADSIISTFGGGEKVNV